jgi:glucose-6-phosphate 1-epimerase
MSSEILLKNEFGYIERYAISDDIEGLRFVHHCGEGSVSLYGGQVLTWQPKNQQPIFWLSQASNYSTSHAIRGGIPLCWPWFGGEVKIADGSIEKTHNHGFARQSQWQLDDLEISESQVSITLSLAGERCSSHWPAAFKLSQKLVFSQQFQQTLIMTNLSEQPVEYTGALHSYFCVSSPEQSSIPRLKGVRYDDKLSAEKNKLTELDSCVGPIDRVYYDKQNQRIVDQGWQREIKVSNSNCRQWVLWNPGETAKQMADMHLGSEHEFVCLEAANTNWQVIKSFESVSISQNIAVKTL